jgi:hypothetical protein
MTPAAVQDPWKDVAAARLAVEYLTALAPVRDQHGVRVHTDCESAWVRWLAGNADVVRCLLPVPGVVFFTQREGLWFRFGSRLPTAETPPSGDGHSVSSVLFPSRFEPLVPGTQTRSPVRLGLVRGGEPKGATALACGLTDLTRWSDIATTRELVAVRAARCGNRAVLLGSRLPAVASGTRFFGTDLLVPVGFRPEPDLPPAAIRAALGADDGELVLFDHDGAELIPEAAFEPLTRAGVRTAIRERQAGAERP